MINSQSIPHQDSPRLRAEGPEAQATFYAISPIVADVKQTARFPAGSGNRARILAGADQTGGAFTVLEYEEAIGFVTFWHSHLDADEMLYVLDGILTVVLGDQCQDLGVGSYVFIPKGVPHAQGNRTRQPLRLLVQYCPSGFEGFFPARQALEEQYGVDTLGYRHGIEAAAAQYHFAILGPAPQA